MLRSTFSLLLGLSALGLTGCSGNFGASSSPLSGTQLGTIRGTIYGGQQPIQGAHVYVFAVGTSGYGGPSTSLLTNVSGVTSPDTTTFPGQTIYYVTSSTAANNGSFSITGDYTCTPGTTVYLYASGGSPDAGAHTNSAIGMMAGLGTCPAAGTMASLVPFVNIDEISTVATAYALGGFAVDGTHISTSNSTQALTGLSNAINNVAQVIDVGLGTARTATSTSGSAGIVPTQMINTLGNILGACINSTSNASSNCASLLKTYATSDSTPTGTAAVDTAAAAINIAHFPGANVTGLYAMQTSNSPFPNGLATQPNDFAIGIRYSEANLNGPQGIAIDSAGTVYVANTAGNTITHLSALGVPSTALTGGGMNGPTGIAIDSLGKIWTTNYTGGTLSEFSALGSAVSTTAGFPGGLNHPQGISMDATGNVWVASTSNSSLVQFSNTGTVSQTVTDSSLVQPYAVAVDGAGSAWATSFSGRLVKASSTGMLLSPTGTGYTNSSLLGPRMIVRDSAANSWVGSSNDTLAKFNKTGTFVGSYSGGGMDTIAATAVDGAGTSWYTNNDGNSISHFSTTGAAISGSVGYQGAGVLYGPTGIAIDLSGNVWVANRTGNYVTEFLGAGAPVICPIVAGLPLTPSSDGSSSLGTKP